MADVAVTVAPPAVAPAFASDAPRGPAALAAAATAPVDVRGEPRDGGATDYKESKTAYRPRDADAPSSAGRGRAVTAQFGRAYAWCQTQNGHRSLVGCLAAVFAALTVIGALKLAKGGIGAKIVTAIGAGGVAGIAIALGRQAYVNRAASPRARDHSAAGSHVPAGRREAAPALAVTGSGDTL